MISARSQCKWLPYRGAVLDCFSGRWGAGDVPSVMSSTSPLSPKHLAVSVLLQEQTKSGATARAVAGYFGAIGGHRDVSGATYCVNFHVVGLPFHRNCPLKTQTPSSGTSKSLLFVFSMWHNSFSNGSVVSASSACARMSRHSCEL